MSTRVTGVPAWVGDDRLARAAWSRLVEPPDLVAAAVLQVMGASEAVWHVVTGSPLPSSGLSRQRLDAALARWRVRLPGLDPERDVRAVGRMGGRVVVPSDDEWPSRLGDLGHEVPSCLWVRGSLRLGPAVESSVSIVGTRSPTAYGDHMAGDLACGVSDRGLSVVSGAAFGIDGKAHRGALAVAGTTVAVLAGGVDVPYPRSHDKLIRRIAEEGLVVSEQAPGASPMKHRFLERNRLIAALTQATVVVEAAWRSGAIATANRAAGLNRPLGAVPGPVTSPVSAGCHRLIRESAAVCVTDAADLAELAQRIGSHLPEPPPTPAADHDDLDPVACRVLEALPVRSGRAVDSLARVAGLTGPEVSAALGRLDLAGLALGSAATGGTVWRRAPTRAVDRLRPQPPGTLPVG